MAIRITIRDLLTAARHRISRAQVALATAAFRGAWATILIGELLQRLGERMEAKAERLADRLGGVDEALAALSASVPMDTLTGPSNEALSH